MALAYALRAYDAPRNDMRSTAVLTCVGCGFQGKLVIQAIGNNPNMIEKLFIRMGWDCDVHNARKNWCPKCVRQRAIRLGQEEKPKTVGTGPLKPEYPGLTPPKPPKEEPKEMSLKDLSPEQKTALRNELGGTFDEKIGRYLDGNSDFAIAEKIGVPRKLVVEFREAFYGELKDDPQVTAFRQQLSDAERILSNLQDSVNKMKIKLDEIAKRVGV